MEHVRHGDMFFYNSLQIPKVGTSENKDGIADLISLLATEEIPQPNYLKIAEFFGVDPEYYKPVISEALQKYQGEY